MHSPSETNLSVETVLTAFQDCITNFTLFIDHENSLIKDNKPAELINLLPFKRECSENYEFIMLEVDKLMQSKALSRADIENLSQINRDFMRKSAENYTYLENSHQYSQRLLNLILKSFNEINKNAYTAKGENQFVKSNIPLTLSQTF
jgi:hypothetical protein